MRKQRLQLISSIDFEMKQINDNSAIVEHNTIYTADTYYITDSLYFDVLYCARLLQCFSFALYCASVSII